VVDTPAQDAFEVGRIVRLEHVGFTREIEVPQARHPEAQGAGAQHVLPVRGLGAGQRPDRVVGREHGFHPDGVQFAGGEVDAPVIDRNRQVEQPLVVAGEVEVEEAAEAAALLEQHVVAEQVAVAGAARQRGEVGAVEEGGLVGDFLLQQLALAAVEEGHDLAFGLLPPRQAAQVGLAARVVLPGQVHAGEHVADLGAVGCARPELRGARQARDDGGRLALEGTQDLAVAPGDGRRHADAVPGQMVHQVQVIRELRERQPLENGQHVFVRDALARHGQEEIAVLDARGDAAQFAQFAKVEIE